MSNNLPRLTSKFARLRSLSPAGLILACALCTTGVASAQTVTPPTTPTQITPPAGNTAFLEGHAFGSQGYTCLPTNTGGTSWTVNPPRPEATLFTAVFGQPLEIITHFTSINESPKEGIVPPLSGNATWQSSFDSSRVWATATPGGVVVAGTDPESCPNNGSIPCIMLQSVGNQKGPAGGRLLANTTFVQRLNTNGGAAPTTACTAGQTQLVPYTADYYFYHKAE
jgi:Protein of unknown function (DUF3455)